MQTYKIGFVLDDTLDSTDGVQQYILSVGQWFAEQGHDVHYLVGKTARSDIPNIHSLSSNIPVSFNQNRMSIPLPANGRKIKQLLASEQFDVLHIQMPYSPLLAGKIIMAAPKKTAVIGTFHVAPYGKIVSAANYILGTIVHRSIKRFDKVMSVSKVAQDFARQTHHIDSQIIPNTIDTAPYAHAEAFPEFADRFTITFFGRLVERKGAQHFLKAIFNLKQSGDLPENCTVLICGKGPLSVELQEYVSQHGLEDIVTFTGYVTEEDKPRYLASSDILVYPSTGGESFGIVLLEGMAAGRGVVLGGDNPGYRSVLHDKPEQLFNPKSEEQFAAILRTFIQDEGLRLSAAKWQQSYVKHFDRLHVCKQILAVYEEALHRKSA